MSKLAKLLLGGGNPVANAQNVNGNCVGPDGSSPLNGPSDGNNVFPKGFTSLYMVQGFNNSGPRRDLLSDVVNTPELAAITKSLTVSVSSMPSGHYTLVMSATDAK